MANQLDLQWSWKLLVPILSWFHESFSSGQPVKSSKSWPRKQNRKVPQVAPAPFTALLPCISPWQVRGDRHRPYHHLTSCEKVELGVCQFVQTWGSSYWPIHSYYKPSPITSRRPRLIWYLPTDSLCHAPRQIDPLVLHPQRRQCQVAALWRGCQLESVSQCMGWHGVGIIQFPPDGDVALYGGNPSFTFWSNRHTKGFKGCGLTIHSAIWPPCKKQKDRSTANLFLAINLVFFRWLFLELSQNAEISTQPPSHYESRENSSL